MNNFTDYTNLSAEDIQLIEYYKQLNQKYSMIPLDGISKKPKEHNWQQASENQRIINEAELLNKNLNESNLNNVGIVTGKASKLIVLDVDNQEEFAKFAQTHDINISEINKTYTIQTKKGYHYYFVYPDGLENYPCRSHGKIFDIRGDRGMVLAPGCIHPDDKSIRYKIANQAEPLPCPQWIKEYSKNKKIPINISNIKVTDDIKVLIEHGEEVGKRSESIMKVLISLAANNYSFDRIKQIFDQFSIGEKMREKGTAGSRYLKREYDAALNYIEKHGIIFDPEKYDPINSESVLRLDISTSLEIEESEDDVEWIIENFWAKNSSLAIIGDSGAGKSTFALNIFYNIISPVKSKFLETFNINPGNYKTLILNGENARGSLKKRTVPISKHFSVQDCTKHNVSFVKNENDSNIISANITDEAFLNELGNLIVKHGFNILCIDPLSCFNPVDENSNSEVRKVLNRIGEFSRDLEISLVVLHHTPKNLNSAKQMSGRGAGSFENWAHTEIGIFKKPNKQRILTCKKSRDDEEFADIHLQFNSNYVFLPLDKSATNLSNIAVDAIKNLQALGTQHIKQKDACDEIARLYEQINKDTCSFTKARRILLEAQSKNLIKKDNTMKSYIAI